MAEPITIFNEQSATVENSYTLPPNLAFEPTAVTAFMDGSGSDGDFIPTLTFYSQDGQVLSRAQVSETIPQGGTCRVSFAPF